MKLESSTGTLQWTYTVREVRAEVRKNDTRPQRLSPVSIGQLTFAFSLPTIFFL